MVSEYAIPGFALAAISRLPGMKKNGGAQSLQRISAPIHKTKAR
jgi:hypothetical protein